MATDTQMAAEQAAIEAAISQRRKGRRVRWQGIDVTPYIGARSPGIDQTKMFSDPASILKDPKPGATYLWKDPDDTYTKGQVRRQVMKPVTMDRVLDVPWANVNAHKILTSRGPREVVRSPGGKVGLFEIPNAAALSDAEKALLPGDHWEHAYLADMAESQNRFEADIEELSAGSTMGRAKGSFDVKDTKVEMI